MPVTAVARAWLVTSLVAGGCALSAPTPLARVRRGPAFEQAPSKVLALPARCDSVDDVGCDEPHTQALEVATRMSLEFAGYRIVDSELVNLELRERVERIVDNGSLDGASRQVEVRGATFASASPGRQSAVLGDLGVDGVLSSRIAIGGSQNLDGQRTLEVQVTMSRAADRSIVWTSRCAVETGRYHQTVQAVDLATRCALDSATSVEP